MGRINFNRFLDNKYTKNEKNNVIRNIFHRLFDEIYPAVNDNCDKIENLEATVQAIETGGSHGHLNKTALDGVTDIGLGDKYLSDDGTYKTVIGGNHTHVEDDITDMKAYANLSHEHVESDIIDLGNYSLSNHNHDSNYSSISHNHNATYYNKTEIDNQMVGKADTHTHPYASNSHHHNGVYEPSDSDIVKAPGGVLPALDGGNLTGISAGASYPSMTGNSGKVLAVNGTEDDTEWVTNAGGGGATQVSELSDGSNVALINGANYWTNSHRWSDGYELRVGTSNDMRLKHQSNISKIQLYNSYPLHIKKEDLEEIAVFNPDGAVELYYDGVKKLETTNDGVSVDGDVEVDGAYRLDFDGTPRNVLSNSGTTLYVGDSAYGLLVRSNGTVSVDGDITLENNKAIKGKQVDSTIRDLIKIQTGNEVHIGSANNFLRLFSTNIPLVFHNSAYYEMLTTKGNQTIQGDITLENNKKVKGKTTGGTPIDILYMSASDDVTLGSTGYDTVIIHPDGVNPKTYSVADGLQYVLTTKDIDLTGDGSTYLASDGTFKAVSGGGVDPAIGFTLDNNVPIKQKKADGTVLNLINIDNFANVSIGETGLNKLKILGGSGTAQLDTFAGQYDIVTNDENGTTSSANRIWTGTQAEYDLLTPDSNTLYFIQE